MQVAAFGFNLILTTKLNLTSTTEMTVKIKRPDSTVVEKTLTETAFQEPSSSLDLWLVQVPIEEGDLSVPGTYQIQLSDTSLGRKLPSAIGSFNVLPNLI